MTKKQFKNKFSDNLILSELSFMQPRDIITHMPYEDKDGFWRITNTSKKFKSQSELISKHLRNETINN